MIDLCFAFLRMVRAGAAVVFMALWAVAAQAEDRIALIIGNGAYGSVEALENASADAKLVARTLETKGFTVTLLTETSQIALNRGIAQFGRDLRAAGSDAVGLFYYAGHGVQSFGRNYLLPVDVSLTDAADLDLAAIPADSVLRQMASARNRTNIVILDACRDNPFVDIPDMNDTGLAEMNAPTGTYLAYSTAPGAVALDGTQGNSPFTRAFVHALDTPGLPIEQVFKQVRVEVLEKTDGFQTPWDTSSLVADFIFESKPAGQVHDVLAAQMWDAVKDTQDPQRIQLFLQVFPGSAFEDVAQAALQTAKAAPVSTVPNIAQNNVSANDLAGTEKTESEGSATTGAQGAVPTEQALMDAARQSGKIADFRSYLDAYPNGIYAELAELEVAMLTRALPANPKPAPRETDGNDAQTTGSNTQRLNVTFTSPLSDPDPAFDGNSIADFITKTAAFPPIEGLPEPLWKDQPCATCHNWTPAALCEQGGRYRANSDSLNKPHPFGGALKLGLAEWAVSGCQ